MSVVDFYVEAAGPTGTAGWRQDTFPVIAEHIVGVWKTIDDGVTWEQVWPTTGSK